MDTGLLIETEQINGAPRTWKNVNVFVAANKLALLEYEIFKLDLKRSKK